MRELTGGNRKEPWDAQTYMLGVQVLGINSVTPDVEFWGMDTV